MDLDNPFASEDLGFFISQLRKNVRQGEERSLLKNRKMINRFQGEVLVGSLAHELVDLLHLFGPLTERELINLYLEVKSFSRSKLNVVSTTLSKDMKTTPKRRIGINDVVSLLVAVGIINERLIHPSDSLLSTSISLDQYFMFVGTRNPEFIKMRSRALLRKRSRLKGKGRSVYRSVNRG